GPRACESSGGSMGFTSVVQVHEAIGVQAGTSSHIRNYLGFPDGVSGGDLAVRAYTQAWNFGAEYVYGSSATGLRGQGRERIVIVGDGGDGRSPAGVIAPGMAHPPLRIPSLAPRA